MRPGRALRGLAVVTLGWLMAPATVRAQPAPEASFHDARARDAYRARRFEHAARHFFAVQRVAPNPRNLYNLALCFEQLDRPAMAFYYFSLYLQGVDEDEARRARARDTLQLLLERVARISVETEPPGADVFVDQREHGSYGSTPVLVPISPGSHRLWIERDGHRPHTSAVEVESGGEAHVRVELVPVLGRLIARAEPPGPLFVRDADGITVASGSAEVQVDLRPGLYAVEAAPVGHRTRQELARLESEETVVVVVRATPLPAPTGALTVTSNLRGALVELNGDPLGFTPAVLPLVPTGSHELRISAPEVRSWSTQLQVSKGARGFVTATLEPEVAGAPSAATWIVGSVGAVTLVGGVVATLLAAQTHSEFEAERALGPSANLGRLRSRGRALNVTADVMVITGLVGLGSSVFLYLFGEPDELVRSRADVSWLPPEGD